MKNLGRAKRMLWLFGFFKIPMIGFVRPRLLELDDERMVIKIRLGRKTRNHLGSMYFGALAVGADLAGAFQAFFVAEKKNRKISIAFKDFQAEFIKRPESDVYFISEAGVQIADMINETIRTGERVTQSISIQAVIHYPHHPEVVAEFRLGLSVKDKE